MLLVHSSIKRTLFALRRAGFDGGAEIIFQSFLKALGPTGTLVLPLFNFDFTTGVTFDVRTTPSQMGALTEQGRMANGAVRTGHPIYSFAAIGAQSHLFEGIDNFSGYGPDSPFAVLHANNAKIGVLDLSDFDSMTFYHYVEEAFNVDYRLHKKFSGNYVTASGEEGERTYGLFVRDVSQGVQTDVNPMGERLWERGLYTGDRPGVASGFRAISCSAMYDEVAGVISRGAARGLLYSVNSVA